MPSRQEPTGLTATALAAMCRSTHYPTPPSPASISASPRACRLCGYRHAGTQNLCVGEKFPTGMWHTPIACPIHLSVHMFMTLQAEMPSRREHGCRGNGCRSCVRSTRTNTSQPTGPCRSHPSRPTIPVADADDRAREGKA